MQFCTHGAYPTVKGQRLNGEQLDDIVDGLAANSLLRYDYLLTGEDFYCSCSSKPGKSADSSRLQRCDRGLWNPSLLCCQPASTPAAKSPSLALHRRLHRDS